MNQEEMMLQYAEHWAKNMTDIAASHDEKNDKTFTYRGWVFYLHNINRVGDFLFYFIDKTKYNPDRYVNLFVATGWSEYFTQPSDRFEPVLDKDKVYKKIDETMTRLFGETWFDRTDMRDGPADEPPRTDSAATQSECAKIAERLKKSVERTNLLDQVWVVYRAWLESPERTNGWSFPEWLHLKYQEARMEGHDNH